jgi:hypothetical protein
MRHGEVAARGGRGEASGRARRRTRRVWNSPFGKGEDMSLKAGFHFMAVAALAGAVACGTARQPETANTAPANANAAAPPAEPSTKVVREEAGPDGSQVVVKETPDGQRVEVRTWKEGPIRKVTRRERRDKTRVVRVVYRDGRAVRVDDENTVENALEWTGAQIADAAKKFGREVGDRSEDVAEEAADKAEDVKDQTVGGAKKAANEVADKAEDVKDQAVKGAKKVGEAVKP